MSPTIRISQDTYEQLQEHATPFTDTPDSVIRRLLGLDTADAEIALAQGDASAAPGSSPTRAGRPARDAQGPRAAVAHGSGRAEKRRTSGPRSTAPKGASGPGAKRGARAPRGSLMHEADYEIPILAALSARGGRAGKNEVLDALEPLLADKLTELDRTELNSGEIR